MKFLVLGCNGMAGHTISIYFSEKGHNVTGFARKKSLFVDTIIGDAFDTKLLEEIIISGSFDYVINCIGLLNQAAEINKANAVYLNSFLPHFLADISKKINTKIVHISTDCVFSGKRGQYKREDFRDGESFYDRTKSLGEIDDNRNLTLRSSIIGPDLKSEGPGLFNWFMSRKSTVFGFTKVIWNGQTNLQLAKSIEMSLQENLVGIHNMVPKTYISKYHLLCLFNKYFRNNTIDIKPDAEFRSDKSLAREKNDFKFVIPSYDVQFVELRSWIERHRDIYPHYDME